MRAGVLLGPGVLARACGGVTTFHSPEVRDRACVPGQSVAAFDYKSSMTIDLVMTRLA